jgi:hypothetical protein
MLSVSADLIFFSIFSHFSDLMVMLMAIAAAMNFDFFENQPLRFHELCGIISL